MMQISMAKLGIWASICVDFIILMVFFWAFISPPKSEIQFFDDGIPHIVTEVRFWESDEPQIVIIGFWLFLLLLVGTFLSRFFYDISRLIWFNKLSLVSYSSPITVKDGLIEIIINGAELALTEGQLSLSNTKLGRGEKNLGSYPLIKSSPGHFVGNVAGDVTSSDKGIMAKNMWYLVIRNKQAILKPKIRFSIEVNVA